MKKSYTKPQLWAETFQPADAIAGPCDLDVKFGSSEISTCRIEAGYGDLYLFNNITANVCDTNWNEGFDQGCYHTPVDGNRYFGS